MELDRMPVAWPVAVSQAGKHRSQEPDRPPHLPAALPGITQQMNQAEESLRGDGFTRSVASQSAPHFSGRTGGIDRDADLARAWEFTGFIRDGKIPQMLERIEEDEIDLNAVSLDGTLPLCVAAWTRNPDVVNALLQAGAKPNHRDEQGQTPLVNAVTTHHEPTVKALLAGGADVNMAAPAGEAPIHIAARMKDPAMLHLLLGVPGIKVNQADENGETALHCAADRGHMESMKLLLAAHADVSRVNCCHQTPLDVALDNYESPAIPRSKSKKRQVVHLLLAHGGHVRQRTTQTGHPVAADPEVFGESERILGSILHSSQESIKQAEQLIHFITQQVPQFRKDVL